MDPAAARECLGSDSPHPPPRSSVAPATAMLSKSPPPSLRYLAAVMSSDGPVIPPLSVARFDGSFGHFCSVKGLQRTTPRVGQREVNLHSLHEQVMKHRGYIDERGEQFWLKIARKLGFISPDISSPRGEIAYQLAEIYKSHLEQFDKIYVMSYMQEVEHRRANATMIA